MNTVASAFRRKIPVVLVATLLLAAAASPAGQWLKLPTPGIPRTADGRADLNAPVPRGPNGKPVLAGLWRPSGKLIFDIRGGLKPGDTIPYQPWAEARCSSRSPRWFLPNCPVA
jgi:hypothetical protein